MYKKELQSIMEKNPEIEAIILTAKDGLTIESAVTNSHFDPEELAAKAMALVSNVDSYSLSPLSSLIIKNPERKIFVVPANDEVFIVALSKGGYDGKINFYLKSLASRIKF